MTREAPPRAGLFYVLILPGCRSNQMVSGFSRAACVPARKTGLALFAPKPLRGNQKERPLRRRQPIFWLAASRTEDRTSRPICPGLQLAHSLQPEHRLAKNSDRRPPILPAQASHSDRCRAPGTRPRRGRICPGRAARKRPRRARSCPKARTLHPDRTANRHPPRPYSAAHFQARRCRIAGCERRGFPAYRRRSRWPVP